MSETDEYDLPWQNGPIDIISNKCNLSTLELNSVRIDETLINCLLGNWSTCKHFTCFRSLMNQGTVHNIVYSCGINQFHTLDIGEGSDLEILTGQTQLNTEALTKLGHYTKVKLITIELVKFETKQFWNYLINLLEFSVELSERGCTMFIKHLVGDGPTELPTDEEAEKISLLINQVESIESNSIYLSLRITFDKTKKSKFFDKIWKGLFVAKQYSVRLKL